MIEAFLHGKLSREQENMEDMLTSCVFGSFRLVPPNEGLIPFLALSEAFGGDAGFLPETPSSSIAAEDVEYEFWPMLQAEGCHRCEPDLLVTIKPIKQLVLVEAKLFSGKSTGPDEGTLPYDQLAREWDNVVRLAELRGLQPSLVYLNADIRMPKEAIRESIAELREKRREQIPPRIYWLSWQHLQRQSRPPEKPVLLSGVFWLIINRLEQDVEIVRKRFGQCLLQRDNVANLDVM